MPRSEYLNYVSGDDAMQGRVTGWMLLAALVQSSGRYNDVNDAPSVELDAKDAILLLNK
jgi:hypothetical protein